MGVAELCLSERHHCGLEPGDGRVHGGQCGAAHPRRRLGVQGDGDVLDQIHGQGLGQHLGERLGAARGPQQGARPSVVGRRQGHRRPHLEALLLACDQPQLHGAGGHAGRGHRARHQVVRPLRRPRLPFGVGPRQGRCSGHSLGGPRSLGYPHARRVPARPCRWRPTPRAACSSDALA